MTYVWTYQLDAERGITGWIAGANPDGESWPTRPPPSPLHDAGDVPLWRLTPEGKLEPSGRKATPEQLAAKAAKETEKRERAVIRENLVDLVARAAKGEDVRGEIDKLLGVQRAKAADT